MTRIDWFRECLPASIAERCIELTIAEHTESALMQECNSLMTAMVEGWHWNVSDEGTRHWLKIYSIAMARMNVLPFPDAPGDAFLNQVKELLS